MRLGGLIGLAVLAAVASCSSFNGDGSATTSPDGGAGDGGVVPPAPPQTPPPPGPSPTPEKIAHLPGTALDGITATASWVYVTTQSDNGVHRLPIDGNAQPARVASISGVPRAMATSGTTVYVGNVGYSAIGRFDESDVTAYVETDAGTPMEGLLFAGGAVWWTGHDGAVHRMSQAGVDLGIVKGGLNAPAGLAADADYVYFASSSTQEIWRTFVDGGSPAAKFSNENDPRVVALSGDHVFWSLFTDKVIRHASPTTGVSTFASNTGDVRAMAADDTYVYWQNGVSMFRARVDGTGAQEILSPASYDGGTGFIIQSIVVTPKYVFWIDAGRGDVWRLAR